MGDKSTPEGRLIAAKAAVTVADHIAREAGGLSSAHVLALQTGDVSNLESASHIDVLQFPIVLQLNAAGRPVHGVRTDPVPKAVLVATTDDDVSEGHADTQHVITARSGAQRALGLLTSEITLLGIAASKFAAVLGAERTYLPEAGGTFNPCFLVFEFLSGFVLWPRQVQMVHQFLERVREPSGNRVIQALMGSGKSAALNPLLSAILADGSQVVTSVVPAALTDMSRMHLMRSLSTILGRSVVTLQFERFALPPVKALDEDSDKLMMQELAEEIEDKPSEGKEDKDDQDAAAVAGEVSGADKVGDDEEEAK